MTTTVWIIRDTTNDSYFRYANDRDEGPAVYTFHLNKTKAAQYDSPAQAEGVANFLEKELQKKMEVESHDVL